MEMCKNLVMIREKTAMDQEKVTKVGQFGKRCQPYVFRPPVFYLCFTSVFPILFWGSKPCFVNLY